MSIHIEQGDITKCSDDAIVNAANEGLLPGGGVCGAIHQKSGPSLEKACREIGCCHTGSAVITEGFGLPSRYVIHAVGPRWLGGNNQEEELLKKCYQSIFEIVEREKLSSVAIPAISTGIFGYPLEPATKMAIDTATEFLEGHRNVDIRFVCFGSETYTTYKQIYDLL